MKRKMLISIALIIIMLSSSILPVFQVYAATNVAITLNSKLYDGIKANLMEQGIYAKYNDAQRTLYIDESLLDTITKLKLSNYEIEDLTGLENFKNLTNIDLSSNELDEQSNLEVLNNYDLEFLDLSSNEIQDVSMITDINNIETLNLHNQKFNQVNIIEMDTSTTSDNETTVSYDLPQILTYAGTLKSEWLIEEKSSNDSPYINWTSFDPSTLKVTVITRRGTTPLLGMDVLRVNNITDSDNKLYNSNMNLFYITVQTNERGIVFKDRNLYNAIKEQLTKGQEENEDIMSFTDEKNLYERAFDEPMVLVINIDDLINKITSLKLNNKQISDLTGIEYFVGLEKELDVSENYIDSIDKIIELKHKKEEEQANLQQRFKAQLALVREVKTEMDGYRETQKKEEANLEKLEKELAAIAPDKTEEKAAKENAISETRQKIAEAKGKFDAKKSKLISRMDSLYNIYIKEYKLTTILTKDLKLMTDSEYNNLTYAKAKELYLAQVRRMGTIEPNLTEYEKKYIIEKYHIPTETTENVNGETVTKEIENPIKTYFDDVVNYVDDMTLSNLKTQISNFRKRDIYLTAINYCFLERLYTGSLDCLAHDYLERLKEEKTYDNESTASIDYVNEHYNFTGTTTYNLVCDGTVNLLNDTDFEIFYATAGKFVSCSDDEINTYVILPKLKKLNISENMIENIDRISEISELKELYAGYNELINVNNVDWSAMKYLIKLDLSMNDISEIKCLENATKLKELYVARNLINGSFNFDLRKLPSLTVFDLSQNQIDDIEYLIEQLSFFARAYNMTISEYLQRKIKDIRLNNQELTMTTDVVRLDSSDTLKKVNLPNIFRQVEQIDFPRTSFGITSLYGKGTANGKEATLYAGVLGTNQAVVTITNGTKGYSIAHGTSCSIIYNVIDQATISDITITSEKSEVDLGETVQLAAEINGTNNPDTSVTWELSGNNSENTILTEDGKLTIGSDETASSVEVMATSNYDLTKNGTKTITVKLPSITSVAITPNTAEVQIGKSIQLEATVEGENNPDTTIKWSVSGNTSTRTKVSNGKLTIGENETATTITVTATSKFDTSKKGTVTITIVQEEQPVTPTTPVVTSITVTPATAEVEKGNTVTLTATVQGSNNPDTSVTWSVSGNSSSNTRISNEGVLTVGSDETANTLTIKATSNADNTKDATATITVKENAINITLGYQIQDEYILDVKAKTPVADFKNILTTDCTVKVIDPSNGENKEAVLGYVKTGMLVKLLDSNGNELADNNGNLLVFEVVVKGDINGDGVADSLDSNYIKAHINETTTLQGSQFKAADINKDNLVDQRDSKLLLYHRAEVNGYDLNYKK